LSIVVFLPGSRLGGNTDFLALARVVFRSLSNPASTVG
jgi:hypothetical protein